MVKVLQVGVNAWRIERATRAAVLVDGAAYFGAVREALCHAQRSVFIMGWDFHSRMRLVGEAGDADDDYPVELAPFLTSLVNERPELHVHLLLWDFAMLYAGEREWLPKWRLDWATPDRFHFCLDSALPIGASQHQKLVVIDDAVAFSGGLDLTIRRWDTSEHAVNDDRRVDSSGKPYAPFHDVQAIVDAGAARALSEIARDRWRLVTGAYPAVGEHPEPAGIWPRSVRPMFEDIDIAIARTRPAYNGEKEVREVERLFLDSIDAAKELIYVENQFLTCTKVAEHLCAALKRNPKLEAVFVTPHSAESWIESHTMRYGRIRFAQTFANAGVMNQVRLFCASIPAGTDCVNPMIHSKVMVVDDRLLRIGSANLNNRSMGTDTECDLAIEAHSAEVSRQIARVRDALIAEHSRCSIGEIAASRREHGSMIAALDQLSKEGGCLRPIDDGKAEPGEFDRYLEGIADPERPISYEGLMTMFGVQNPRRARLTILTAGLSLTFLGALGLLWYLTPLADLADPTVIRAQLDVVGTSYWAPFLVVAGFLAASVIAFPINILIVGTAAAFGPWLGMLYAAMGAMVSALLTYAIGRWVGKAFVRDLLGKRLNRIREKIVRQGIVAVAAIRLVPVAPFTIVNLAAGASEIRLVDYLLGSALGLAPGLIAMSFLGHQASDVLSRPTLSGVLLLLTAAAAWIAIAVGAQLLVSRFWKKAG